MNTNDPQQVASAQVVEKVYTPVFFQKLAQVHGLQPRDAAEANVMLNMAAQLRVAYDMRQQKSAASSESPLLRSQRRLNERLNQTGLHNKQAAYSDENIRQSAAAAALDPALAASVLRMLAPANL